MSRGLSATAELLVFIVILGPCVTNKRTNTRASDPITIIAYCLKVTYTADGVHLDLVNLVRRDGGLIIAQGAVAFDRCSDIVTAHPVMFVGGTDASLQLPGTWTSTAGGFSVQLTFTTNEPDGLLVYILLGDDGFLAVELFEGVRPLCL